MTASAYSFAGVTIPPNSKRLFVTADLVPSNGNPLIQPTGFPDVGPVFYPDPSGRHGQICLIESEASMANRLEEVCMADKYTGTLCGELASLPYLQVQQSGQFRTSSTIEGHRFASQYVLETSTAAFAAAGSPPEMLVEYVKRELGASSDGKRVPAANVPTIFRLAMELDPLALIHGFQISLGSLSFVGLRSPRSLCATIVGLNARPVGVPGVKFDPIGTSDAGQAIFRRERIVADVVEASFTIDIALIRSLKLADNPALQGPREELLIALCLWKIARFLWKHDEGNRLRSECDLRLNSTKLPTYKLGARGTVEEAFPFDTIATQSLQLQIAAAQFPATSGSPLQLQA